jgi:Icc-related predicted phosphoesterase
LFLRTLAAHAVLRQNFLVKILAVSDQVVDRLYHLAASDQFKEIDLILGCGDLPYTYLEYLVTILNVPLCYVPGNHDPQYNERSPLARAEGGLNVDLRLVTVKGIQIAGLGGSIRYNPAGVNQYTQAEAYLRALRLLPSLLWSRLRYGRPIDILITHSPPFGIHDEESSAHRGLRALNTIIRLAQPRYHLHGHTHFYRQNLSPSLTQYGQTQIMNVYPYKIIEISHER